MNEELKHQECKRSMLEILLLYVKKQIKISHKTKQTPKNVKILSKNKLAIFYESYVMICYLQKDNHSQEFINYPRRNWGQIHAIVINDGFVMESSSYWINKNGLWQYMYKSTEGSYTDGYLFYLDGSGIMGEVIRQHSNQYIKIFGTQNQIIQLQSEGWYNIADDSSLFYQECSRQTGNLVKIYDLLLRQYFYIQLPEWNETLISLFVISPVLALIITLNNDIPTLYHFNIQTKQLLRTKGFPEYYSGRFQKINRQQHRIIITFSTSYSLLDTYIIYDYCNQQIIWKVLETRELSSFSNDLSLYVEIKEQEFGENKLVLYQAIRAKRMYMHLIIKSGILKEYGEFILKKVLKVLY